MKYILLGGLIIFLLTGVMIWMNELNNLNDYNNQLSTRFSKINEDILSKINPNTTGKEKLEIINFLCTKTFPDKLLFKGIFVTIGYSSDDCKSEYIYKMIK